MGEFVGRDKILKKNNIFKNKIYCISHNMGWAANSHILPPWILCQIISIS